MPFQCVVHLLRRERAYFVLQLLLPLQGAAPSLQLRELACKAALIGAFQKFRQLGRVLNSVFNARLSRNSQPLKG